ncbi:MAG: U32 family peptidase [Bacteroidales bacterium]|nr:U32 family peptidase [Bacteroidales bacterium]MBN2817909.1 U32 family peptidase [Bacteroidales bacterium]
MGIKREDIEIMAPVGSYESLMAAIQAGADAVYFGLSKMNMRSRSSINFDESDLDKILDICKKHNINSYLTLNIVIFEEEITRMKELVDLAAEKGITAIIASDHSVIHYARSKGVEVHVSTQVNISNSEAVRFYSEFADVMVLARELNMDQVSQIYKTIQEENILGPSGKQVKLEMFVHGALCMATSGKCYMSLHELNYSANRGACLQVCRRGYTLTDKETGRELDIDNEFIMSPKDLSTIHFLNKILDAGVRVLKIEGRARPAEYVKIVTRSYNEAVNSIIDGSYNTEKINRWKEQLSTVFNRGFWDGYYLGQQLGEWSHVYGSRATRKKIYVGKCTNYFSNIGVGEFTCEASELHLGEEIIITGQTTGVLQYIPEEIREDLINVKKTNKGIKFSIAVPEIVRRNDKLFRFVEPSVSK